MSCDRRQFLAAAGAGLAGAMLPALLPGPLEATALESPAGRLGPIGVQLYTLRSILPRDFEGTLAALREIGYREVEFAGYHGRSVKQVRSALDRAGLSAPASHVPFEALRDEPNRVLDEAEAVGHKYLVVAWLAEADRQSVPALVRTAAAFNRIGEQVSERGLHFAYHNHDFEFVRVGGRVPFDLLLDDTVSDLVSFEMDLFWVAKGGADPLAYFEQYPGRFPLVHVKDMAAGQQMTEVGKGHIDWRRIFAKRKLAGIEHYFVEHDEPTDPLASVRTSYDYLRKLRF
jgi:sugar phosphate isomerase/epimerase